MIKKQIVMFFMPNLSGGGAEKVTVNIIRALNEKKYEIHLVLVEKTGEYLDAIPEYVIIHDLEVKKTVYSILKLRKYIEEIQPNIVYSTLIRSNIALYLSLLYINIKPYILLRSPNSPKLLLKNKELNTFVNLLLGRAYKNADLVLAQTPEMKFEIHEYYNVKLEKIKVFLNPIDSELIEAQIKNVNTPFDNKYINVVAAGRLTKQKGFDILIKSFKKIVTINNNFRLYIIGSDNGEKDNLLQLINTLKLHNNIKLIGFQNNPYVYYFYADLFVLSSRWEGLPNTVLENLYLKKPIVSTKCIPFMEQLIDNGKNGFLVNIDDIDGLANAILNYKLLTYNSSKNINNASNVEELFNVSLS